MIKEIKWPYGLYLIDKDYGLKRTFDIFQILCVIGCDFVK